MPVPLYQAKAEFFKTLGHPARIRILELLSERDHAVHELLEEIDIEPSNLSQQLAVLRRTSLVVSHREGSEVIYSVSVPDPTPGQPTAAALAQTVRAAMVPGAPRFPAVTVWLPATVDAKSGAPVSVVVPGGASYKLRADGGYIARGANGPVVRPFGPGPVAVHATVVDDLARVTVATSTTTAGPQPR